MKDIIFSFSMKEIKTNNKTRLKIKPDMTRITITLEGQNKEYDKTLAQSSRDTEALKDILEKVGFATTLHNRVHHQCGLYPKLR